jgi:hypothetical protein
MRHAELSREEVMIRNIKNRMISPHSVLRPYGFRPVMISRAKTQAAIKAPAPVISEEEFQGGHNID